MNFGKIKNVSGLVFYYYCYSPALPHNDVQQLLKMYWSVFAQVWLPSMTPFI